jgi:putative transposase
MNFEPENVYHIYNRGNQHQLIFFIEANYLLFLRKIREHLLPHSDILSWCLMPNHFHLMICAKEKGCQTGQPDCVMQTGMG